MSPGYAAKGKGSNPITGGDSSYDAVPSRSRESKAGYDIKEPAQEYNFAIGARDFTREEKIARQRDYANQLATAAESKKESKYIKADSREDSSVEGTLFSNLGRPSPRRVSQRHSPRPEKYPAGGILSIGEKEGSGGKQRQLEYARQLEEQARDKDYQRRNQERIDASSTSIQLPSGAKGDRHKKLSQQAYADQLRRDASQAAPEPSRSESYARQLELNLANLSSGPRNDEPYASARQRIFGGPPESEASSRMRKAEQQEKYRSELQSSPVRSKNAVPDVKPHYVNVNSGRRLSGGVGGGVGPLRPVLGDNDSLTGLIRSRESASNNTGLMLGSMRDANEERSRKKEQQQQYAAEIARSAAALPVDSSRSSGRSDRAVGNDYKTRGNSSGGGVSSFMIR